MAADTRLARARVGTSNPAVKGKRQDNHPRQTTTAKQQKKVALNEMWSAIKK